MDTMKKVLIVDDEQDLLTPLSSALEHEGYRVLRATDGVQGLDIALAEHPDVMVLDLLMPEKDGHQLLAELRKDPWGKDAKVIVMTSHDSFDSVAEVLGKGVHEYAVKSQTSLREIIEKINTAIGTV
jgi:DNA-binding response OmpR family regulator